MTDELIVRGGYVLSMDDALGDLPGGDVHVRDGAIVAVGTGLRADCPVLDATGTIVLPGLVDTHWHLWTSLYRSMAGSSPATAYFALNAAHGAKCHPEDLYHGVRLGLVDAVNTGITTVHDWSHNVRGPQCADAMLDAHAEIGLRGRFSYGPAQGQPADVPLEVAELDRVRRDWFAAGRLPLMHLGLAGRAPGQAPESTFRPEYEAARDLGLPVSYHANSTPALGELRMIGRLAGHGMLSPDTQLVHALYTDAAERAAIRDSGASVSISPWSELLIGYGVPPVRELAGAGVRLTLSVDTLPLNGTADLWSAMRLAAGLHRAQARDEFAVGTRRILAMSTIEAARSLGLGDLVGSLTPGKRADLITVRTDRVGTAPFGGPTDPANTLVLAAGPQHVDTVLVDGRVLKRDGALTTVDEAGVVAATGAALAGLLRR